MEEVLVVGYGNTLRRDDGVGPRVAESVAQWGRPGVRTLALPQLVPELAEPLARVGLAIFVDAAVGIAELQVEPLVPAATEPSLHHTTDPRWLLLLARSAYGCCPPAWLITVPVADLNFGEGLSPTGQRGLESARKQIAGLLRMGAETTSRSAAWDFERSDSKR